MSRSLDLLLVGLVGGLGWWLFAREERPLVQVAAAPPTESVAEHGGPPSPSTALLEAPGGASRSAPTASPSPPVAVSWAIDDPALLAHPSFQFVVAEPTTGRLLPLAWQLGPDGRVTAQFAPGQRAVGLALVQPTLEVLAWIPLDATTGLPEELPIRLGERFARIAFDVRDPDGRVVHDARLSLRRAEPARALDGAQPGLPVDADGKVLVPRRPGVRIDLQSAHGTATVEDPFDGRTVQLTPRQTPR